MITAKEICEKLNVPHISLIDYEGDLTNVKLELTKSKLFNQEMAAFWWMNVWVPNGFGIHRTTDEVWRHNTNLTRDLFKFAKTNGSYNTITNQAAISLSVYQKSKTEIVLRELAIWTQYQKQIDNQWRISIFEKSLSQYGYYELIIEYYPYKAKIIKTSWGVPKVMREFDNLDEAINYIKGHLYYE